MPDISLSFLSTPLDPNSGNDTQDSTYSGTGGVNPDPDPDGSEAVDWGNNDYYSYAENGSYQSSFSDSGGVYYINNVSAYAQNASDIYNYGVVTNWSTFDSNNNEIVVQASINNDQNNSSYTFFTLNDWGHKLSANYAYSDSWNSGLASSVNKWQLDTDFISNKLASYNGNSYLPFNAPSNYSGSNTFSVSDLTARLANWNLNVTDGVYDTNPDGTHVAAGQVISLPSGGFQTDITATDFINYMANPNDMSWTGMLDLHEVAHLLPMSQDFYSYEIQSYKTRTNDNSLSGFQGSPEFWINESYVNNIAAAMENALGITPPINPQGGYTYSGTQSGH